MSFKRNVNWNSSEINALVQAVSDHIDVITGRLSPSLTSEHKFRCWEDVVLRVNAVSSTVRSLKEIKKKWQTFQSNTKAKENRRLREARGTGGGSPPKDLSEIEKTALTIIPVAMVSGIDGGFEMGHSDECTAVSERSSVSAKGDAHDIHAAANVIQSVSSSTHEGKTKKRKSDSVEDFQSKLLRIEERKLQIEEEILNLFKTQTETLKQICLIMQSNQVEHLLDQPSVSLY